MATILMTDHLASIERSYAKCVGVYDAAGRVRGSNGGALCGRRRWPHHRKLVDDPPNALRECLMSCPALRATTRF